MSYRDLRAKFDDNTRACLSADQQDGLAAAIARLDALPDASELLNPITQ